MQNIPQNFTDFDLIGDIHGHANDLKELLTALDYKMIDGVYQHPTRKVLFVGDYIDRGTNVVEVLAIVKGMVDHRQAIALMGNHEYNAICYNHKNAKGEYFRLHNAVHTHQHKVTRDAFKADPALYQMYIEWFQTLPLFYEGKGFRAVHACWDDQKIALLKQKLTNNCITLDLLEEANDKNSALYDAIEDTLKGKEIELPQGQNFSDKDGHLRTSIRIKWWVNAEVKTYQSISVLPIAGLSNEKIPSTVEAYQYPSHHLPVFFGHYWLPFNTNEPPKTLTSNVCCLDYSVAKQGKLICYRYNGEPRVSSDQLFYV